MIWSRNCSNMVFGDKSCLCRIMFLCRMDALLIKEAIYMRILLKYHRYFFADTPIYHQNEGLFCGGNVQVFYICHPPQ